MVRSPIDALVDDQMVITKGGDLGQVGDHQHLVLPAQGGQGLADGHGRLAADPGVDLVEDQRRRVLDRGVVAAVATVSGRRGLAGSGPAPAREHQADRQHGPGQLAPRSHLGQRQQRFAGVGPEQPGDAVSGAFGADVDRETGSGHGEALQGGFDVGRQGGPGGPAGRPDGGLGGFQFGLGGRQIPLEGRAPKVVRFQLGDAGSGLVAEGDDLFEGVAVLAPQVGEDPPAGAHLGEPIRVVLERFGRGAGLAGGIGELRLEGQEAIA